MAACKVRDLWEKAGGKGAGAFDYAQEKVDGGKGVEPINIHQIEAANTLGVVSKEVGSETYVVMIKICAQGIPVNQLSKSRREASRLSEACKAGLDIAAEYSGINHNNRGDRNIFLDTVHRNSMIMSR